MAQATGAISFKDAYIAISSNGSTWTDISGYSNMVQVAGGERQSAEFFTADGDTPIFTVGKRGTFDLTVNCVFVEPHSSTPAETIRSAYEGATDLYVRWVPAGNTTGNARYTAGPGKILSPVYPAGDASTPDPIALEFTIKTLTITKDEVS
jgi:hypothetical protein